MTHPPVPSRECDGQDGGGRASAGQDVAGQDLEGLHDEGLHDESQQVEGLHVEEPGDGDDPVGDTTVRPPRVPSRPRPGPTPGRAALAGMDPAEDADHADDTVVGRRGSRAHDGATAPSTSVATPGETVVGGVAAYGSRVAAPVRGSRKLGTAQGEPTDAVPDASEIRRAVRARARRRLAAVVAAIVGLVVVMAGALIALVFAVGV